MALSGPVREVGNHTCAELFQSLGEQGRARDAVGVEVPEHADGLARVQCGAYPRHGAIHAGQQRRVMEQPLVSRQKGLGGLDVTNTAVV